MNRSCRGTLGPLLAVVCIAYSCSSLATAQNNAFGAAASAAIAEQSQHMQQQLNQQQVNQPLPLLMGKTLGLVRVRAVDLRYRLEPADGGLFRGSSYSIAGKASNEWQDHRTEFGPIFTF